MTDPEAQRCQQPCPAEAEIAAFVGGMVDAGERRRIVAHLASCERCYAVFAGAAHVLSRFVEPAGDRCVDSRRGA
jgi:anti-sigma factor RsiW